MGGDQGPFVIVKAVIAFLEEYSDVGILLVGTQEACDFFTTVCSCPNIKSRVELILCKAKVDDSESLPSHSEISVIHQWPGLLNQ